METIDFTLSYVAVAMGFDRDFAVAVREGNQGLRTQMSEDLWQLRADGTLGEIVGRIAADLPGAQARLPHWYTVLAVMGAQTTLLYVPIDTIAATGGYSFTGRAVELWACRNVTDSVPGLTLASRSRSRWPIPTRTLPGSARPRGSWHTGTPAM